MVENYEVFTCISFFNISFSDCICDFDWKYWDNVLAAESDWKNLVIRVVPIRNSDVK